MNEIDSTPEPQQSEHDTLMSAALAADQEESGLSIETPSSATKDGEGKGNEDSDRAVDPKADSKGTDNPESSADKKDDPTQKQDEQKPKDDKSDEGTKYERAKKEQARKEKTWKQIETEKQQVRQEQERLRKLGEDIERRNSQSNNQGGQPRFDSRQFAAAAQEFDKKAWDLLAEGDQEGAKEQRALAAKAMQASNQAAHGEAIDGYRKFESEWQSSATSVIKEFPEYGDPSTEQAQQMAALLESEPILVHHVNGFRMAHNALKLQREAAEASGLREENTKLKTENERLNKLLNPQGEKSSAGHAKPSKIEDLPLDQQRDRLQRDAELADAA